MTPLPSDSGCSRPLVIIIIGEAEEDRGDNDSLEQVLIQYYSNRDAVQLKALPVSALSDHSLGSALISCPPDSLVQSAYNNCGK